MKKRILLAMFGSPAAIGVLSKLDSRLDFSPLLERMVLGFRRISDEVWARASEFLSINLAPYGDLLTIVMLLLLPVLVNIVFRTFWHVEATRTISEPPETLEELKVIHAQELKNAYIGAFNYFGSFAFIIIVLHLFELGDLWIALVLPGMCLAYFSEYYSKSIVSVGKIKKVALFSFAVSWVVILVLGVVLFMKLALMGNDENVYSNVFWVILLVGGLALSWLFYRASDYCSEAITNVALWVSGILIINWVTESLIPAFATFLDSAGA